MLNLGKDPIRVAKKLSSDTPTIPDRKACASCGKEFTRGETVCTDDGTILTPIRREGLTGIVADKYEIISSLGDGGWGTVYKAEHILLKRPVAIKTLHQRMVESGSALKRFKQEALAGSQLDHPNILNVLDFGITPEGVPYIVMDYLEGQSLAELLDSGGALEPKRAMKIFVQVASALAHAHRNGVIHRDLKPANIMLVERDGIADTVKIVDFGIAKIIRDEGDETSKLTETGQLFGSPLYMSPEQCTGKNLDGRSDIYSLGCVAYRTLAGHPPFQVRDLPDCIYKHVNEMPAPFEYVCPDRHIPQDVEGLVFKCLSKNPNDRYQTMTELEDAIKTWLDGKPLTAEMLASGTSLTGVSDSTLSLNSSTAPKSAIELTRGPAQTLPPPGSPSLEVTAQSIDPTGVVTSGAPPSVVSEPEAANTNASHMIALVATAIIILMPIGYFLATKGRQEKIIPSGPVNTALIKTAMQNAEKPNSAAQTVSTDEAIKAGIEKFNDGRFDLALRAFSAAAYKQPLSSEAVLWQGLALNELFRYNEAKKLLQQFMKKTDERGANAARALNGLGFSCSNTGQFDEAQGYFDRGRAITESLKGADRVVHAQTLRGMAELALSRRELKKAQMMLEMALKIDQQFGAPVLEIAYVENDLGQTYEYQKDLEKARECYDTALTMRQNKMKGNNPLIAYSLKCIASVDYQQKKFEDSEKRLKQALSINQQDLSEEAINDVQRAKLNLDIAAIYTSLGSISETQRRYPEALQYNQQSLSIQESIYGAEDPRIKRMRAQCDALARRVSRK